MTTDRKAGQYPITIELCGEQLPNDRMIIADFGPTESGIRQIRTIGRLFCHGGPEERDAYGRLIAAAPDLLAALESLTQIIQGDMGIEPLAISDTPIESALAAALAAISRAQPKP